MAMENFSFCQDHWKALIRFMLFGSLFATKEKSKKYEYFSILWMQTSSFVICLVDTC